MSEQDWRLEHAQECLKRASEPGRDVDYWNASAKWWTEESRKVRELNHLAWFGMILIAAGLITMFLR